MPSRKIEDCVPKLIEAWKYASAEYKKKYPNLPQPFLTCTYRSNEEQDELYAQGRTKPGPKVTNAKGGQSKHNHYPSEAFDIAFKDAKGNLDWNTSYFKLFGDIITPLGIEHGIQWKFKDAPHFQTFDKK